MINTEKARSELIVAPVLMEARQKAEVSVALFSGVEFNVDEKSGLKGVCDFLLTLSSEQLAIGSPIDAVAEAKNENFVLGYGQCLAEMIAAKLFNKARKEKKRTVFGVVTTGTSWKFLKLVGDKAYLDDEDYHISQVDRVVGILVAMLRGNAE